MKSNRRALVGVSGHATYFHNFLPNIRPSPFSRHVPLMDPPTENGWELRISLPSKNPFASYPCPSCVAQLSPSNFAFLLLFPPRFTSLTPFLLTVCSVLNSSIPVGCLRRPFRMNKDFLAPGLRESDRYSLAGTTWYAQGSFWVPI